MKYLIIILSSIWTISANCQKPMDCEWTSVNRVYSCTEDNKWASTFQLGIMSLDLDYISIEENDGIITVAGSIVDKEAREPIDVEIALLMADSVNCRIIERLENTNNQKGEFVVQFDSSKSSSLYLTSPSMAGLEIKINNCR